MQVKLLVLRNVEFAEMVVQKPLVSVIIPCYNGESHISNAIEGALRQTYNPIEVIVVDDGSTDNSLDIIRDYDDQVVWHSGKNQGACHARNIGLEQASGTFVKFLDADDTLLPKAVETQVRHSIELNDKMSVIFGDARYVRPDDTLVRETNFGSPDEDENRLLYILRRNVQTSLPLHRQRLLNAVGGFSEDLLRAQEYDLHFRLAVFGATFRYRSQPIARILQHGGDERISNQNHFIKDPRGRLQRIRERATRAEDTGLLDDALRRFLAQAAWHSGRMALRQGFSSISAEYFRLARSLHGDHITSSSTVYRGLVHVTNPRMAERFASLGKSAIRTLKHFVH